MRAIVTYGRDNYGLGSYTIQTRIVVAERIEIAYMGPVRHVQVEKIEGVESDELYERSKTAGMLRALRQIGVEIIDARRHGRDGTPIELMLTEKMA